MTAPVYDDPSQQPEDSEIKKILGKQFKLYNKIVKYKTLDVAISRVINDNILPNEFDIFKQEIHENFIKNYDVIINDVIGKKDVVLTTGIYNMNIKTSYKKSTPCGCSLFVILNTYSIHQPAPDQRL